MNVTLFPEPDSPTTPRVSPSSSVNVTPFDGLHEAVVGGEVHAQVAHLQQRRAHR